MKLPLLKHPERYTGLYVVDFGPSTSLRAGDTCAVGYTAEEVAMLVESEQYAHATLYRIHAARPDGTMELKGVPNERFKLETGLFFYSRDLETARREYEEIHSLADGRLPCRAQLLLGEWHGRPGHEFEHGRDARATFVVGLAYPAEYDEDVSKWMLDNKVSAGQRADGGVGRLEIIRRDARIIDSAQLSAVPNRRARNRDEVFAGVGEAIQRIA
ncbi:MAG: hypothetical protein SVV80_02345 [Planctomycetota bacterium]|nr:hypothetical protein [Planctomycetota bacterium]